MGGFTNLHFFLTLLIFIPTISIAADTLTATKSLRINETLLSSKQVFELGFFSFSHSKWYLGVWYKNITQTYVWVANRDAPLENSTGVLKFGNRGNIVISDQAGNFLWTSNQTAARNPVLQLLDNGNLILREETETDPSKSLWQSFDYPTDTLLPGMKLRWNLDTGMEKHITSWTNAEDPSTGYLSFMLESRGLPEIFLRNDGKIIYRSGPWNGFRFNGVPEMAPGTDSIKFMFESNEHEAYYSFSIGNQSLFSRLFVNPIGELQQLTWIESSKVWNQFWYAPKDQCDYYKTCGAYGICDRNLSHVCKCVNGFSRKNQQAWNLRDGSDGCVRNTKLDCRSDKFLKLQNVKLPDTSTVFVNRSMSLLQCADLCKKACSCTAYANVEITDGGIGCVMWSGDLVDIQRFTNGGADLYIKVAYSELDVDADKKRSVTVIIVATVIIGMMIAATCSYFLWALTFKHSANSWSLLCFGCWKRRTASSKLDYREENFIGDLKRLKLEELPLTKFEILATATGNFHSDNKLGHGGFGSVYKGKLQDGHEIAVKRLSKASGQGLEEFMNEVVVIPKLRHRNLVRLLGYCIEGEEKMLIYEYLPNKSLDALLFDPVKKKILDWHKRFNIIEGIVRGLLYLHRDSKLKIIHRDLKASNILLDEELYPKISDFGLARIFGRSEDHVNTKKIVGTCGYISPEYAMKGLFSEKSDVFSFGVLLLEIISGKKNTSFYDDEQSLSLLGFAWKLWEGDNIISLIDPKICDPKSLRDIVRCIHIGLLCVQELARDRPDVATVLSMLNSEIVNLPAPRQPAFMLTEMSPQIRNKTSSINDVTITSIKGR